MHIVDQIKNKTLKDNSKLDVIIVCSNPVRYHSRYRLFRQCAKELAATSHVRLHVVEGVYKGRQAECAPVNHEYNYQEFKLHSEIWVKENLINLGVKHLLPKDWKYVAWVDADIHFRNDNWALDTLHALQHYQIVQPWKDALDLSFDGGVMQHFKSFGYFSAKDIAQATSVKNPYCKPYGHTGFAWACTRAFYENVEKLLDFGILGAGDAHMAYACIGRVQETINQQMAGGYKHLADLWQAKAKYACAGLVGYVPGRIEHFWHGPKAARKYGSRWQILVKYKFDPMKDLKFDHQGVLKLKGKPGLEHAIMRYNRERSEDSID